MRNEEDFLLVLLGLILKANVIHKILTNFEFSLVLVRFYQKVPFLVASFSTSLAYLSIHDCRAGVYGLYSVNYQTAQQINISLSSCPNIFDAVGLLES